MLKWMRPTPNTRWNLELKFPTRAKTVFFPLMVLLSLALLAAASCSPGVDEADESDEADDMALVWEAWDVLVDNYAAPEALDESAVAGGAINRIMALGDLDPYPFLVQVGRMRGQVPDQVPDGMIDVWRAAQLYSAGNPDGIDAEVATMLIRGLVEALPERAAGYLTAEQAPEAQEQLGRLTEGSYVGIGSRVESREGRILLHPFPDSPAEKAGIEPGDVLTAVEREPVANATPREVGDRIKGEEGTKVLLTLERETEPEPLELEVFRGNVELQSISTRLTQGGIGYLRIHRFRDNTGQQVFDALEELKRFDALALILDLRFNPGGSADAAAEVASQFLAPGEVFITVEGRDGVPGEHVLPEDDRRLSLDELPVAVLIDDQTIGEAEAVAAALHEAGRATLVGMPSSGEGSTYELVSLSDGSAIYIPTSRWFTPAGNWVGEKPLQPDILVEYEEIMGGPGGEMQFNTAYEYLDSQLPLFR